MEPSSKLRVALLFPLLILAFPLPTFPEDTTARKLDRRMDPVVVRGEWLEPFLGTRLEALRLYRHGDGQYEPIRFQVDERTPEGAWIFPHGKKNNGSEGDGLLDERDVLLFMARDAGARAHPETPLQGDTSLAEIELEDPVHRPGVGIPCRLPDRAASALSPSGLRALQL